jgi:hypothetical protein
VHSANKDYPEMTLVNTGSASLEAIAVHMVVDRQTSELVVRLVVHVARTVGDNQVEVGNALWWVHPSSVQLMAP